MEGKDGKKGYRKDGEDNEKTIKQKSIKNNLLNTSIKLEP